MYVKKNKIPPPAAPESAEIIKYWYFVTFSKMTCGKNMRANLRNNKATLSLLLTNKKVKKVKTTFTRRLLHRNRPLTWALLSKEVHLYLQALKRSINQKLMKLEAHMSLYHSITCTYRYFPPCRPYVNPSPWIINLYKYETQLPKDNFCHVWILIGMWNFYRSIY